MHGITKKINEQRDALKPGNRLKIGTFQRIHDEVLTEYGLDKDTFEVKKKTVASRIRSTTLTPARRGPKSPAAEIEPLLLTFAKYRQEAGQPLKPSGGIMLATSLLEGSKVQETVKNFQRASRKEPTGRLSPMWWRGFLGQNKEVLCIAKGHRLHNARLED
jgi:hypothetical protein